MAFRAYILANVKVGKLEEAMKEIANLPGILEVERTSGPADMIAIAEVADQRALGTLLKKGFQSGPLIERTVTCITTSTPKSETLGSDLLAEKMLVSVPTQSGSANRLARTSAIAEANPYVAQRRLDIFH